MWISLKINRIIFFAKKYEKSSLKISLFARSIMLAVIRYELNEKR